MKRTFLAIKIVPDSLLRAAIDEFKSCTSKGGIKWVNEEQLHLTIQFFGSTSASQIRRLSRDMRKILSGINAFELQIQGLGSFKKQGVMQILWAGIEKEPTLTLLAKKITEVADKYGFKTSAKTFKPHLTLARIKTLKEIEVERLNDVIENREEEIFQTVWVNKIMFYESVLTPQGPIYHVLKDFSLHSPSG